MVKSGFWSPSVQLFHVVIHASVVPFGPLAAKEPKEVAALFCHHGQTAGSSPPTAPVVGVVEMPAARPTNDLPPKFVPSEKISLPMMRSKVRLSCFILVSRREASATGPLFSSCSVFVIEMEPPRYFQS